MMSLLFGENGLFIILLVSIMGLVHIITSRNILSALFNKLLIVSSNRPYLFPLAVMLMGCLPIPGRVIVVNGVLDSFMNKEEDKKSLGIISYLATHHYYLWSPLEPAVLVTVAGLGLTYSGFIQTMVLVLVVAFVVSVTLIAALLKDVKIDYTKYIVKDVETKVLDILPLVLLVLAVVTGIPIALAFFMTTMCYIFRFRIGFKELRSAIDIKLVLIMIAIVLSADVIKSSININILKTVIDKGLLVALLASFGLSFILGSSGKYAAITVFMVKIFGIKFLPLFYIVDYCAYLLSPTHKCVVVGFRYFKTEPLKFYLYLSALIISVIIAAITTTFY